LPYPISAVHNIQPELGIDTTSFGLQYFGFFSLIAFSIVVYYYRKQKYILLMAILMLSTILIYSTHKSDLMAEPTGVIENISGRWLIPTYVLGSMMFGNIITQIKNKWLLALVVVFFVVMLLVSAPARTTMGFSMFFDGLFIPNWVSQ